MALPTNLKGWQEYYRMRFKTNECPHWPSPKSGTNISSLEIIPLDMHEFPTRDEPQSPAADVLLALSRYDVVLAELREAAKHPQSRFPINYRLENPLEIARPHLADLKKCVMVLQLRAIAELEAGQTEQALADVKLILRLAETIRGEPFSISYLVRFNFINQAIQPIWEGLAGQKWSETELKELSQTLSALDFVAEWQACLRAELVSEIGLVEYLRRNRDGQGYWGRIGFIMIISIYPRLFEILDSSENFTSNLPEPINRSLDSLMKCLPGEKLGRIVMKLPPDGWYELNKVALAKFCQEQLFPIADAEKHLVSGQKAMEASAILDRKRKALNWGPQSVFVYLLIPATSQMAMRFATTQNGVDMATLACALERYRLEHKDYPPELTALEPDFVPAITPDVVNGEPLHYRRTENGRFLLYSVGWNGKDDGGVTGTNQFSHFDPRNGDWVWQYLAPN
jgi:hypothetical protein